jgi:AbrB family looped-hinge helix DNA binding protein
MVHGIINGMNLHVDKAGRLVLPKSVRAQLGITPQTPLELVQRADGVLLRRVAERPSMEQVDGLWVHRGVGAPGADWTAVIDNVRNERADGGWPPG